MFSEQPGKAFTVGQFSHFKAEFCVFKIEELNELNFKLYGLPRKS